MEEQREVWPRDRTTSSSRGSTLRFLSFIAKIGSKNLFYIDSNPTRPLGCFYSIIEFRTEEQCLTPSQLVWIYGRCSVEEVGIDGSDVESSIRGFNIVSEDGNPYSVVWVYTSPDSE